MKLGVFAVAVLVLHSAVSAPPDAEPIRLHPTNPHYFLYKGKAIALVTSGEHYGSVINADFDFRKYLATLQADGLNYTRLFGGVMLRCRGNHLAFNAIRSRHFRAG